MPRDDYTTDVVGAAHEARDVGGDDLEREVDDVRPQHHYEVPVTHEDFAPMNPHTFDREDDLF